MSEHRDHSDLALCACRCPCPHHWHHSAITEPRASEPSPLVGHGASLRAMEAQPEQPPGSLLLFLVWPVHGHTAGGTLECGPDESSTQRLADLEAHWVLKAVASVAFSPRKLTSSACRLFWCQLECGSVTLTTETRVVSRVRTAGTHSTTGCFCPSSSAPVLRACLWLGPTPLGPYSFKRCL